MASLHLHYFAMHVVIKIEMIQLTALPQKQHEDNRYEL
jgi:hypothetical protein